MGRQKHLEWEHVLIQEKNAKGTHLMNMFVNLLAYLDDNAQDEDNDFEDDDMNLNED